MRTGYTIITRESAWDENARGQALRLAEYEASMCTCGCGLPMDVAHDGKQPFLVDKYTCHAGRAMAKVSREADEEAKRKNKPDGWKDGVHYYVTLADLPSPGDTPPPTRRARGGNRG